MASLPPAQGSAGVVVRPAELSADIDRFVAFPLALYHDDRHWIGPPPSEMAKRLDPQRNPFFKGARRRLFLAYQNGQVVGTAAAIFDDARNRVTGDSVGFFGFFETVDDLAVAKALLSSCATWLAEAGATMMRGPVNGSANDERGILIEGFETRPALWEGHNPPYYARLLEDLGLRKQEDASAFEITYDDLAQDLDNLPTALYKVAQRAADRSGATLRSPTAASWADDLPVVHELYVRAHATLAGHAGMSYDLFASLAESMRPIVDLDLVLILELGSQPVGLVLALPEIYEALGKTSGRYHLWDKAKLWWYLRSVRSVSVKVIGILPDVRNRGLDALMMLEIAKRIVAKGYDRCEISLVSEHNSRMIAFLERIGAKEYRRYRVFEADLPFAPPGC